jgi:hypothetical protein
LHESQAQRKEIAFLCVFKRAGFSDTSILRVSRYARAKNPLTLSGGSAFEKIGETEKVPWAFTQNIFYPLPRII